MDPNSAYAAAYWAQYATAAAYAQQQQQQQRQGQGASAPSVVPPPPMLPGMPPIHAAMMALAQQQQQQALLGHAQAQPRPASQQHQHQQQQQQPGSSGGSSSSSSSSRRRSRSRSRDRDSRERRRRSRSRSRSRSRDRDRDRDRRRDRSRSRSRRSRRGGSSSSSSRSRSRSRSPSRSSRGRFIGRSDNGWRDASAVSQHQQQPDTPTATIMLRNLPLTLAEGPLQELIKPYGPLDVRIIRDRQTGASRGFAFVDFPSPDAAAAFHTAQKGKLVLSDRPVHISFARDTGELMAAQQQVRDRDDPEKMDWLCDQPGCQTRNFARRKECFRCNAPRTAASVTIRADADDRKRDFSIPVPSAVLVVSGLPASATESSLRHAFIPFAPVADVRLIREKEICFVEFPSVSDATTALQQSVGLRVDGQLVRVQYSNSNRTRALTGGSSTAADFRPSKRGGGAQQAPQRPAILAPTFKWDAVTELWYDDKTGFYFNETTGLYSMGNLFYRWNPTAGQYLQVDERGVPIAAAPTPAAASMPFQQQQAAASSSQQPNGANTAAAAAVPSGPPASVPVPPASAAASSAAASATAIDLTGADNSSSSSSSSSSSNGGFNTNTGGFGIAAAAEPTLTGGFGVSGVSGAPPGIPMLGEDSGSTAALVRRKAGNSAAGGPVAIKFNANRATKKPAGVNPAASAALAPPPLPTARASSGSSEEGTIGSIASGSVADLLSQLGASASSSSSSSSASAPGDDSSSSSVPPPVPPALQSQAQWVDMSRLACLLCQRALRTPEQLIKHFQMSDLHKKNVEIEEYKRQHTLQRQEVDARVAEARKAKEAEERARMARRQMEELAAATAPRADQRKAIEESNVGNRMLKAMGWKSGQGLGKAGGGIREPVKAEKLPDRIGLGHSAAREDHTINPGDKYADIVRRRFRSKYDTDDGGSSSSSNTSGTGNGAVPAPAAEFLQFMRQFKDQNCGADGDFQRPLVK